jgi:hypothetical protein
MTDAQTQPTLDMQRNTAEQQARPELEDSRREAEQQARKLLDKDAVSAIEQTLKAIDSIAKGDTNAALQAIQEAAGKIGILLARNPDLTFVPVKVESLIIDVAPLDLKQINELADAAAGAVSLNDLPEARVLLGALTSELRVRTYNLPLGMYPGALQEAARLLDQNRQLASKVLLSAVNSLVAVDQVTPIPLLVAQDAIKQAQGRAQEDKNAAQEFLELAQFELNRAKALGYAGLDPEYTALKDDISNIKKQLKTKEDTASGFSKLKARLEAFLKRQSERRRASSTTEQSSNKAA